MKIIFVSSLYKPNIIGGAEKIVEYLAEGLSEKGYDCSVITLWPGREDKTATINGVKIYYLKLVNMYWPFQANESRHPLMKSLWHLRDIYNPFMSKKVGRILEQESPDLVCTHNLAGFSDGVWLAAKKLNIKIIHVLHDYYQLCPRSTMFHHNRICTRQCLICSLYSFPKRYFTRNVDVVIGVSKFVLNRNIRLGLFPNAVKRVIHNGIHQPQMISPHTMAGKLCAGFIGRVEKSKGIEILLRTFQEAGDSLCDKYDLLIAGRGSSEYIDDLRRIYPLKNVQYLGFVKPKDFYPKLDVLLVPSIWNEPFGMVILEGLSYGLPVFASNKGGCPEILEHGRQGIIFDPENSASLKETLLSFEKSESMRHNMSREALERSRLFTLERMIDDYRMLIDETL